jgi:hypothetical protein
MFLALRIAALVLGCVAAAWAQEPSFPAPRVASYNEILNNGERDLSTYRFSRHNRVLIIDFPTLAQQGATFNRISAFIERQQAPRDRVLTDAELTRYLEALGRSPETLSYGNNFTVGNLVLFFNVADDRGVDLNTFERALLKLLVDQQMVFKRTGFYQATEVDSVVLSIPKTGAAPSAAQAVTRDIRNSILRHELSHAEFYVNARYAEFCRAFWREGLTEEQRNGFREFFARSTYDTSLEEVVINEWQAYLVHTPDKAAFRGAMVRMSDQDLDRLRDAFKKHSAAAGVTVSLL